MATKPISKKVTLTGTLAALPGCDTFGIEICNSTGADLEYTMNGGDTIKMPSPSKDYFPEIRNTSEFTVKGSGDLYYVVFQNR